MGNESGTMKSEEAPAGEASGLTDQDRFEAAIQAFDEANRQDPNVEWIDGKPYPREWWYAQELTRWVGRLRPEASEALLLAARCQHIERWKIPRDSYPMDRMGYLSWRKALAKFHARRTGEILQGVGYPEDLVRRVQELNLKQDIKHDPETQTLEDALCLTFLQRQFRDFARKTDEEKMVGIIRKTWKKMSPQAREIALQLDFDSSSRALVQQALAGPELPAR
jgi:hypothetical protein